MIKAYAAFEANGELKPFEYEPDKLKAQEVEITAIRRLRSGDAHYRVVLKRD